MAKTLIEVNEEYLAAAREVLQTETKKDTVNSALRAVATMAARRRDLQRLMTGGLPGLPGEQVMRAAWQRQPAAWPIPAPWPGLAMRRWPAPSGR